MIYYTKKESDCINWKSAKFSKYVCWKK